ncbi:hypothetical protein LZ318_23995 [Saccharopolyspora indica]|uniref:hypothetical protein n=1 Tax=Saccharopolyspora indica TaxID=1229659 RepID=UPI0022EA852B|nr:hypothetical protein [Saccharopolyspora indica]MDA3644696.1 hypothetical protein [Saccharopolyspora indica]
MVAKRAEPYDSVSSYCGVEVEAWRVQRLPPETEWVREETCMECWALISARWS